MSDLVSIGDLVGPGENRFQVEKQLRRELTSAAERLGKVALAVSPTHNAGVRNVIAVAARSHAHAITGQGAAAGRGRTKAQGEAVEDVLAALWGTSRPPIDWFRTALGAACAPMLDGGHSWSWTQTQAAGFLAVKRQTVGTVSRRGRIELHPDGCGRVTIASTVAYAAQRMRR